ncbi:MAG: thiamine-phosphate kinase [Promethearchaeota archaeon]
MEGGDGLVEDVGENGLIDLIERMMLKKLGQGLVRDDCFYQALDELLGKEEIEEPQLVLNSDMFVSKTDAPPQMTWYQMGWKAVIMNISDLVVKGVFPRAILISLGMRPSMRLEEFRQLFEGILEACKAWNITYIGGDVNETEDTIVNPTVYGIQSKKSIIYRKGMAVDDVVVANGKFGLTGVGFDILLKRNFNIDEHEEYENSVRAVLEPKILGREALILGNKGLVSASIDSSDGLAKSLLDLMKSNPSTGFELYFDENLIHEEALRYSTEFQSSLMELIFNAGEEFVHIFTIPPQKLEQARYEIQLQGGTLYEIGKVISEEKIYILKEQRREELKYRGFLHLSKKESHDAQ